VFSGSTILGGGLTSLIASSLQLFLLGTWRCRSGIWRTSKCQTSKVRLNGWRSEP